MFGKKSPTPPEGAAPLEQPSEAGQTNAAPPNPVPPAAPAAAPSESVPPVPPVPPAPQAAESSEPPAAPAEQMPVVIERTDRDVQRVETEKTQLVDVEKTQNFAELATHKARIETIESYKEAGLENQAFIDAKQTLLEKLIDQIDFIALGKFEQKVQRSRVFDVIDKMLKDVQLPLNGQQIAALKEQLLDEIFGFGPLEPLLEDAEISDIMVNSHKQVYVEKAGKLVLTDVEFTDEQHLISIIQRIVSRVGRRVDESSPMVDARMPDGSRFNAIIPPLALDGSLVSIRKFKKNKMPLSTYVDYQSMSPEMAKFLDICGLVGLNMIVSGGTGSGKTTLLNALSGGIGHDERIITIEDAAELQLQQPHILRLETRPASMEGKGEITQRQLVKNALRMRPDRIILGEIRGEEVIDVLSAMNTGHDGSMATIHANNPRDCLARIENLVGMSGVSIGINSLRKQISSAIQLIIQIERQRDGKRRITSIEEIVGTEGEVITTQTLFSFKQEGIDDQGNITGNFVCHGIRPKMISRAKFYGKEHEVLECLKVAM